MQRIPSTHLAALRVLCRALPLNEVNWALTGSLAHRLQGLDLTVNDIDVQTDAPGSEAATQRLDAWVLDRPRLRESELISSVFGTFEIHGILVELMGGLRKRSGAGRPWGPATDPAVHRALVRVGELDVPVLTLDYEAKAYEEIGRPDRAAQLRAAAGVDRQARR